MNGPCGLLLDFAPAVDLSCGLKGILESARDPCVELRHEVADHGNLAAPIIRCDPSIVFLLLDQVFLKRAGDAGKVETCLEGASCGCRRGPRRAR